MTLREELAKMLKEMAEEEAFREAYNIHPHTTTSPRDCLHEEAAEIGEGGKLKPGRRSDE